MSGKEMDRARARSAVEVVKAHPGMALFAASPVIVALGVVWWVFGAGWATVLLIAVLLGGGAAVLLKRRRRAAAQTLTLGCRNPAGFRRG